MTTIIKSSSSDGIEEDNKMKKKTLGKRKIEIKMIEKDSSRQVTFCKRRKGLFTKAAELCISTGAEVGIIIQSIGGKTHSFGHPDIDSVINHYRTGVSTTATAIAWNTAQSSSSGGNVARLKQEYDMVCKSLEEEKRKGKSCEIKKLNKNNNNNFWWNMEVEKLGFEELEKHTAALEELKKNVMVRADELMLLKNESAVVSFSDLIDPNPTAAGGYFLDHAVAADHQDMVVYGSDY